ncbi:MAG: sugar ABC transporter permease, partial [Sphaerochaetaceae bacterium]|nr:sugar ABC transporter permease [Sphaerochaetaceae bacterium]
RTRKKVFLLLLPIIIFAVLFVYYPFIKTIVNSFSLVNAKGLIRGFAGLDNYKYTYGRKDFIMALKHTLTIAVINVPITIIITIALALLANKKRKLSPVYELLFTLPMAVSMSAACMIFKSMFSPSVGFINYFFGLKLGWYESQETALAAILILTIWMGIGFNFLLMLSALRGIPDQIIEATKVDGISPIRRIFRVQIPLISPTIFFVLCTNLVLSMMTSAPMIIIMGVSSSASATNTLMSMMFQSGFSSSDYGLAAVLSITAFSLTLGFTILSFVFEKKKVHYQ